MRSLNKNRIDRKGREQGYWEHYTLNGILLSEGSYKNGLKDGYWYYYRVDGKYEYYYKNGNLLMAEL
jgi:antitoxin component YwqK of YwqJK toxin-antitoxin module